MVLAPLELLAADRYKWNDPNEGKFDLTWSMSYKANNGTNNQLFANIVYGSFQFRLVFLLRDSSRFHVTISNELIS